YQIELRGPAESPWLGSPVSPVEPTVVWLKLPAAAISIASVQASFAGTIVTFSVTGPVPAPTPSTAIVYGVPAVAMKLIELCEPQKLSFCTTWPRWATSGPV